jgi:hypothetical protein
MASAGKWAGYQLGCLAGLPQVVEVRPIHYSIYSGCITTSSLIYVFKRIEGVVENDTLPQ